MKVDLLELRKRVEKIKVAGEIEGILQHDTAYGRLTEAAAEWGDKPAILYFGVSLTFNELLRLSDGLAKGFAKLGIRKNDIVTVSLLATPYAIATFYALDKMGATQHMVNCASSQEEIVREVKNVKSKYFVANDLFCSTQLLNELDKLAVKHTVTISLLDGLDKVYNADKLKYIIVESLKGTKKRKYDGSRVMNIQRLLAFGKDEKEVEAVIFERGHNATIAYTSGSTGNSKACVATWEGIDSMVQVMGMTEQGRFCEGDVMLSTFPLWIYYSLLNMIHEPLCLGVAVALDPLFDPKNLAKRNKQYKFNHWLTIPPYLKKFLEQGKDTDCSNWKIVLTGGAELSDSLKYEADAYIEKNGGTTKVVQGYGASECLGSFAYCYYPGSTVGSMGKPCIGNMLKVLDADTHVELGVNESGVAYFYGPALMKEYYGDKEATDNSLVKDENGAIWYNTEDLVHVNEKGEIFLDGRLRRIALTLDKDLNPTKIIPERTNKELQRFDKINKSEVITVHDDIRENKAVAFVVLNEGVEQGDDMRKEIVAFSHKTVPEYMAVKDVVFAEALPLNANGKPDLKKMEEMYGVRG